MMLGFNCNGLQFAGFNNTFGEPQLYFDWIVYNIKKKTFNNTSVSILVMVRLSTSNWLELKSKWNKINVVFTY